MLDPRMQLWDSVAVKAVIEAAGGVFTDWRGQSTAAGGNALCGNPSLHAAILDLIDAQSGAG